MAESSPYAMELEQACAAVAAGVGAPEWKLVYQSRSGPPSQPWLGPDILDHLKEIRSDVVVAPIGFLSDHMEVIYDLDTEAKTLADELGIRMVRAGTVGTHPLMIEMIAEMVEVEAEHCAAGCCAAAARRPGAG
jgi:ferrochelatase